MQARPIPIAWHSGLSIYASEAYLKTVGDDYGWLGGTDEAGKLRCVLPYTIVRKAILRMVRFRVETIPWGEAFGILEEKSFLSSAMDYFRSVGADLVIPATTNTIFRTYPDGAVAAPYGSYVVDLTPSEETLWNNVHPKHRNVIRNATKQGVEIKCDISHLAIACDLVRQTLKRSGMGFSGEAPLQTLMQSLGSNLKVFLALHGGTVQGAAILPYSQHSAYYLYGGSAKRPVTGAMNLLTWEAMRTFRNEGVRRYDFVGARIAPEPGSKQEGLKMFKERFGGHLAQGYIWKYPIRRLKYAAYCLAVRLRKGGDIVDQERPKHGEFEQATSLRSASDSAAPIGAEVATSGDPADGR